MKISIEHIRNYVDINVPISELCDKMIMAGFEVEDIESQGDKIKNVVAARILKITPHENSDICRYAKWISEAVNLFR